MCTRVVWDRRQGFGQLRFGRRKGRRGIGQRQICAVGHVRPRRSNERLDIVGIGGERAFEKAARSRDMVRGPLGGIAKTPRGMSINGLSMAALPCCTKGGRGSRECRSCVSTGRSIHAVSSITPSPKEGIEGRPGLHVRTAFQSRWPRADPTAFKKPTKETSPDTQGKLF